jgi:hypothetical protein
MSHLAVFYKSPYSTVLNQILFDGSTWSDMGEIQTITTVPLHLPGVPTSDGTPAAAFVPAPTGYFTLIYKLAGSNDLWWVQFDGTKWTDNVQIQNPDGALITPRSDHSPAAVLCNNSILMVLKAANSNDLCFASMSLDKDEEQKWHSGQTISSITNGLVAPKSDVSPSVAFFRNKFFVIYKGESSDDLYLVNFDPVTLQWSGNVKISSQPGPIESKSNYSPSLAVFNDRLFMVYKSPNTYDLNYAFFDGTSWAGNSLISGQAGHIRPQSNSNPGIAVFNGRLFLIYKGPDSNDLNTAVFDGTTWSENTQIFKQGGGLQPQSDINPSAAVFAV